MDKRLLKKYNLIKRLYEIEIMLMKKYKHEEEVIENLVVNPGSKANMVVGSLDDFNQMFGSKFIMYQNLIESFKNRELDKMYIDQMEFMLLAEKNDDISAQTEEFWEMVENEDLKLKRKNNRLLKILKKGYVGGDIDREIFYFGIIGLIKSQVFKRRYGDEMKTQIESLITKQTAKLIDNANQIVKKKKKTVNDFYKLDEIISQFSRYREVLSIEPSRLEELEIEKRKIKANL